MKALKILNSLSVEEKDEFEFVINSLKRETLRKLYYALSDSENDAMDKKEVYNVVFGKKYSKQKDYLLRNELRLLNEQLKEFVIVQQFRAEKKGNSPMGSFMLQKSFIKREMFAEYESEFKKGYRKALETLNYEFAHKMLNEHFNYLMTHKQITPELITSTHELLQENATNVKMRYRTDIASNQQGRAALEAFLRAFGREVESSFIGPEVDLEHFTNPYIQFWEYTSKANNSVGEERISFTKMADECIEKVGEIFPHVRIDGLAKLAGAYYLSQRYEEAVPHYQKALDFCGKHTLVIRNDILYNYCSTLAKLGKHKQNQLLIEEHDWHIRNNPKMKNKFAYLKAFALIFQGEHKAAAASIPQDIRKLPQDELQHLRFVYCILPYLDGDLERAVRETTNYIAYFNHHGDTLTFAHEKGFVQLFKSFYETLEDMPEKSKERDILLANITKELDGILKQYPQYREYQYVVWLRKEIDKSSNLN